MARSGDVRLRRTLPLEFLKVTTKRAELLASNRPEHSFRCSVNEAASPALALWSPAPSALQCSAWTGADLTASVKGEPITWVPFLPPRTCTLYEPHTAIS